MNRSTRRNFIQIGTAASLSSMFRLHAQEATAKPLGIALLGLGDYSTNQLGPALKLTKNARLVSIVTGSPEKIPVWKENYGIADANVYNYETFDKIVGNKDVDIVYVVTPTALHPEFSIRAAKAGKHVICEKPMAPTVADCNRMIEASKAAGKSLQIGYRLHWDPNHLRLMEATKKKEFGDWKSISTAHAYRMDSFNGLNAWRIGKLGVAGALYDVGVYCVQGALYTAGMNPVSVTAKSSTDRPEIFTEVPETYEWVLEFPDGRKADGMASYGKPGNYLRAEIEKGKLEIEPAFGYGGGQKGRTPLGEMNFPAVNQQALQIDGQVASITGKTPSLVPGEMGCRDIQIINGIMEAAKSGKPIVFGEFPF